MQFSLPRIRPHPLKVRHHLGLVLFLDIGLRATLLRLANVVPVLSSGLGLAVTSKPRHGALDRTSNAVGDAAGEVVDLALGFLALACGVLLLPFMLQ